MKLVTRFEAAKLSTVQLYGLRKEACIAFTGAPRDSEAQRTALASMRHNRVAERAGRAGYAAA